MGVTFGSHSFQGPFPNPSSFEDKSGVCLILCESSSITGTYEILDIVETDNVFETVSSHPRLGEWEDKFHKKRIFYAVIYTPGEMQRKLIKKDILRQYPCMEADQS